MTNQKSKFRYTSALRKIRRIKSRIKVIQGGSSASKTFSILAILIDTAIKTPNLEISVVSESIPHLRRGANKDFLKIMKDTGRFIPTHYNKTLLRYEFSNGSYIEFFSADDESRLRGARRNILYINECNNLPYDAYLQLAIRTDGDIYLDFNPSSRFWVHTEVLTQPETDLLILTYKDNEALSDEIIKQLESYREKAKNSTYWENWCKVYLDGEIGNVEGTIYNDYVIIDDIPTDAKLLGYGLDFGYSQDPCSLVGIYKYNDDIVVDEVIYQTGLLNSELSNLMKSYKVVGEIYADSAEPKSIAELKRFGHQVKPVEKGRDSINYGIQIVQQKHLMITRRSRGILDEITKYMWKKNRDGGYETTPIDAYNHSMDALRYISIMKLGVRKEGRGGLPFNIMKT
jgi:phage terminase large subunit